MGAFDLNIPTKFFGLNKQDVRQYFANLQNEQEKAIGELQKKKKQLEKEEEKLLSDLMESKKEIIQYEDEVVPVENSASELISDAYKRVEKTTALINMLADEEAAQLAKKASEKLAEYDVIIEELQESINENKTKIEAMLSDVLKLLKNNVDSVLQSDGPSSEKRENTRPVSSAKKDIELFREKAEESKLPFEKNGEDRITADGTSLSNISKLLMFRKKYAAQQGAQDEMIEPVKKKKPPRDELYDLINGYDTDNDFDTEPVSSDFGGPAASNPAQSFMQFLDDAAFGDEQPEEPPVEQPQAESRPSKSEAEIKEMRNALIIGKIAGEDLLDSDDNVIIPKGKSLTENDIVLAENSAKLPELIINMVLPK